MHFNINKKNLIILCTLMLIILIYYFMQFIKINEFINLAIFSILYISIIITVLKFNEFYFWRVSVLFMAFFSINIGISPIAYYIATGEFCSEEYIIILVAALCFLIGNFIYNSIEYTKAEKKIKKRKEVNSNVLIAIALILIIISILADAIYLVKNHSIILNENIENGRIMALSGNGIIIQLMYLGTIGLCLLYECVLKNKFNKKYFIILACIVIPLTLIKGFRSSLVMPIIIIFLMYNKIYNINNKKLLKLAIIILIIIVLIGSIRGGTNIYRSTISIFKNGSINLSNILRAFPQHENYKYGYTYLINIIMLKPGPDMDFTLWLKDILNITFNGGGVTPTIIGEFYINFGVAGIIIGMILMGLVSKKIEYFYNTSNQFYYSSFIICSFINTTGGGIANIEISLLVTTIIYFTTILISKNFYKVKKQN